MKPLKLLYKAGQQFQDGQLSGGRDHVVGGLGHVHMVIGMDDGIIPLFPSQDLDGPVGYDLVGVHVGGSPGAALDGIHNKLIMQLPRDDLVACLENGLADALVQHIGRHVGHGSGLLDPGQIVDKYRMQGTLCDVEIVFGPQRLDSIIGFYRNLQGSYRVGFKSHIICPSHFSSIIYIFYCNSSGRSARLPR